MNLRQIFFATAFVALLVSIPGVRVAIINLVSNGFVKGIGLGFENIASLASTGQMIFPPRYAEPAVSAGWACCSAVLMVAIGFGATLLFGVVIYVLESPKKPPSETDL